MAMVTSVVSGLLWPIPFLSGFYNVLSEVFRDRFVIAIVSFLIGMATLLLAEAFFIMMQLREPTKPPPHTERSTIQLPQILKNRLQGQSLNKKEDCIWLNFLSQFLFAELKDTVLVRRYLTKKIQTEFEEVLTSRTGVFMDELFLRDYDLGNKFPVFTDVSLQKCDVNAEDIIENLDIRTSITYDGGFQISIDASLPFGRTAYISVKLLKLKGNLRIRFTNTPFSYWCFSFYEEPEIELDVSAQLDGRPVLKLKNVISHQIRKIIKKKHMLPMFKIRYKPFFRPVTENLPSMPEKLKLNGIPIASGILEVTLSGASKLPIINKGAQLYCTVSADPLPWTQMMFKARLKTTILTKELIKNVNDPSLGLIVSDDIVSDRLHPVVLVEKVQTGSPAHNAGLREGEIIVTVNGNKVTSAKQATKLLKTNKEKLIVQVESTLKAKSNQYESENSTATQTCNESSQTESVASVMDSLASGEESISASVSLGPEKSRTRKTDLKPATSNPRWNQTFIFTVEPSMAYLNICVWSHGGDRSGRSDVIGSSCHDVLIGHVNLNLDDVYLHSLLTLRGKLYDRVKLKHGHYQTEAELAKEWSSHKGWNPDLMYGDLTVAFLFRPSLLTNKQRYTLTSTQSNFTRDFIQGTRTAFEEVNSPKRTAQSNDDQTIPESVNYTQGHHQFDSTSFVTATFCDFCGKKIWMKEAFKCRTCSMVCHKKCLVKCLVNTFCTEGGVKRRTAVEEKWEPLTVSNRSRAGTRNQDGADGQDVSLSDRECSRDASLDRANRSENHAHDDETRSPSRFRNLKDRTERIKENVVRSIRKNKAQTTLNDNVIMDAKELGAQLFSDLEPAQRRDKLDELIMQLDEQLKLEMKNKEELEQELDNLKSLDPSWATSKRKNDGKSLENKINKSTDKLNGMRLLMLQYCTALQVCMKEIEAGEEFEKIENPSPQPLSTPPSSRVSYMGGFVKRASSSVKEKMSSIRKDLGKKGSSKTPLETEGSDAVKWHQEERRNNRTLSSILEGLTAKHDKNQTKSDLSKDVDQADVALLLREESDTSGLQIPEPSHTRSRSLVDESLLCCAEREEPSVVGGSLPRNTRLPQISVGDNKPVTLTGDNQDVCDAKDSSGVADSYLWDVAATGPKIARSSSDSRLEVNKMVSLHPDDILRYHGNSLPKVLVSEDDNSDSDDYFILDSSDENGISDFSEEEDHQKILHGSSFIAEASNIILTPEDVMKGNINSCQTLEQSTDIRVLNGTDSKGQSDETQDENPETESKVFSYVV